MKEPAGNRCFMIGIKLCFTHITSKAAEVVLRSLSAARK